MAALALALVAWSVPGARGAALQTESIEAPFQYSTIGNVDSTGVSGTPIIDFRGVDHQMFTAPSLFSLGTFRVSALPQGAVTAYNNTPFSITMTANAVDGKTPDPNGTPVVLTGWLNGLIKGDSQSSVVATFDISSLKDFQTGPYQDTPNILDTSLSLVPSRTNDGQTTAQAQLIVKLVPSPPPVPEPTSVAIFLTAVAGYGLRRRLRAAA